jgi:hypothetical protein
MSPTAVPELAQSNVSSQLLSVTKRRVRTEAQLGRKRSQNQPLALPDLTKLVCHGQQTTFKYQQRCLNLVSEMKAIDIFRFTSRGKRFISTSRVIIES